MVCALTTPRDAKAFALYAMPGGLALDMPSLDASVAACPEDACQGPGSAPARSQSKNDSRVPSKRLGGLKAHAYIDRFVMLVPRLEHDPFVVENRRVHRVLQPEVLADQRLQIVDPLQRGVKVVLIDKVANLSLRLHDVLLIALGPLVLLHHRLLLVPVLAEHLLDQAVDVPLLRPRCAGAWPRCTHTVLAARALPANRDAAAAPQDTSAILQSSTQHPGRQRRGSRPLPHGDRFHLARHRATRACGCLVALWSEGSPSAALEAVRDSRGRRAVTDCQEEAQLTLQRQRRFQGPANGIAAPGGAGADVPLTDMALRGCGRGRMCCPGSWRSLRALRSAQQRFAGHSKWHNIRHKKV
eukprot:scaffold1583_cov299-Pinguiococcus_pyrenoidosus.AAC.12